MSQAPRGRSTRTLQRGALAVAVILGWEIAVRALAVPPFVLPGPVVVGQALWRGLRTGVFLEHAGYTLTAALLGFAVGALTGIALGVLISQIEILNALLYDYVVAFQTIPKVAIAPLLVIWFGFGLTSKVVMTAMISFFPVVVNTIAGLRVTSPDQIMLLRSYSASRADIFRIVQLPSALPFIFAGLDVAIVLSVIGTIVAEFVGSTAGLGYALLKFNQVMDVPGVFASLIVLSALGVALHTILQLVQRKVVFWTRPGITIGA